MITLVFRQFNRKKFSQRTNDMRTRAVLDYLAASTGSETPNFLLFGRLIGLQPRQTNQPRPGTAAVVYCLYYVLHYIYYNIYTVLYATCMFSILYYIYFPIYTICNIYTTVK